MALKRKRHSRRPWKKSFKRWMKPRFLMSKKRRLRRMKKKYRFVQKKLPGQFLPDRVLAKLCFWGFDSQATVVRQNSYQWAGNEMLDMEVIPNNINTIRPNNWVTLSRQYDYYCVMASKIVVTICNTKTDREYDCCLTPLPQDPDYTQNQNRQPSQGGVSYSKDNPFAKYGFALPIATVGPLTLKNYMKTSKVYGNKRILDDDNFWASTKAGAASPLTPAGKFIWNWSLTVNDHSGVGAIDNSQRVYWKTTYWVAFKNKIFNT